MENIKNSIMTASLYSNLRTVELETNLLHQNVRFGERFTNIQLKGFNLNIKSNASFVLL